MALTMWGQLIVQAATPGEAPVQVGTMWVDTTSTPVVKVCTSIAPYTFATASGGVSDGDKGDITVSGSGATWTIDNDVVSDTKLRDSGACSVIGRSANSSGDPADISAASDNLFLRRRSNVLGFGSILASDVPAPGSDTQVMFNDGGVSAGDAGMVYNKTTNRLTIDLLTLLGGQIVFPATQNASADANTQDDYEEGTFTPGDNSGAGLTFSNAQGAYIKVGQFVLATIDVTYPSTANGSQVRISLPFAANSAMTNGWASCVGYSDSGVATITPLVSGSSAFGYRNNDGSSLTNANMSLKTLRIAAIYRASA